MKSSLIKPLMSLSILSLVAASCGKSTKNQDLAAQKNPLPQSLNDEQQALLASAESRPEVMASRSINDSFRSAVSDELSALQNSESKAKAGLVIEKSALNKEFLLQTASIPQAGAALGSGLKSRIVSFRQEENSVFVMEAIDSYSITDELPQNLILAELPIVLETEGALTVDFAKGMSRILQASDWYGSDFDDGNETWESVPVRTSFLLEAKAMGNSTFVLRQIAQLDNTVSSTGASSFNKANPTIELKYYLKPYQPNTNFNPTLGGDFSQFGYFETAPRKTKNDELKILATKFDPAKPIIFAISSNTPAEYRQAVRDGILYWNKAFGSEIMKVVDAPEGVTAPSFDYNVIQWVQNDNAGFAYADAQSDPRTGEILHAQAFMTSVFAVSGKNRAERILKELGDENQGSESLALKVSLRGFENGVRCNRNLMKGWKTALSSLVAQNASDEIFLRASQDYVAEVIAHEVGHTLGLRHNFAGSLASNLTLEMRNQAFDAYLKTGTAPSLEELNQSIETEQGNLSENPRSTHIIASSSVMEYSVFEESVFTGNQMRPEHEAPALPYDFAAIQNLYFAKEFARNETPIFCTDSLNELRIDCAVFDVGRNTGEVARWKFSEGDKGVTTAIWQALSSIPDETPAAERLKVLESAVLSLSPAALGSQLASGTRYVTQLLTKDVTLHKVRVSEDLISELTLPGIKEKEQEEIKKVFTEQVWEQYALPVTEKKIQTLINKALDRALRLEDISASEAEALQPTLLILSNQLLAAAQSADTSAMNPAVSGSQFKDGVLNARVQSALSGKAMTYLFEERGEFEQALPNGQSVTLKEYVALPEARLQAAKLLSGALAENAQFAAWNELNRSDAMKKVAERIALLAQAQGETELARMPRNFREELIVEKALLCELTQGGCSIN